MHVGTGRLACLSLLAVAALTQHAVFAQPDQAPEAKGFAIIASEIGRECPVQDVRDVAVAGGFDLVVVDWAWITAHWGATEFGEVNRLIDALSARGIRVAAMYRPRFLGPPTVPTQVTADGKPVMEHGAEICYESAAARTWGVELGTKILDRCPGVSEVILYNPRMLCDCPACRDAREKDPGARFAAVWRFVSEARETWRAAHPEVLVGVACPPESELWQVGTPTMDVAHPMLSIRDDVDRAGEIAAAVRLREALGERSGACLAKITWEQDVKASQETLAGFRDGLRAAGLGWLLWSFETPFLGELYDPREAAEGLGLDWRALEKPITGLRAACEAYEASVRPELLAEVDSNRQDVAPVAGRYVVVTDLGSEDRYYAAARLLAEHRHAEIARVPLRPPTALIAALQELRAETVAFVTRPESIEPNLVGSVFLASSTMDHDLQLDFTYGFITGETAQDAVALVQRTIEAEATPPKPRRAVCIGHVFDGMDHCYQGMVSEAAGLGKMGFATADVRADDADANWPEVRAAALASLEGSTLLAFCGHGDGQMSCALDGGDLARARLNHAIVFNGTCYANGLVEQWDLTERGMAQAKVLAPGTSVALGLLRAGAICSFGSTSTSAYINVMASLAHVCQGASLGEAFRRSSDALLEFGRVSDLRVWAYRPGINFPQFVGDEANQSLNSISALALLGDPGYVPFHGGLPGASEVMAGRLPAPARAPTAAPAPAAGPSRLALGRGTSELVCRPGTADGAIVLEAFADRAHPCFPYLGVADGQGARALLRVDLSGVSLAEGVQLKRATLRLYDEQPFSAGATDARAMGLFRVLTPWSGEVTWNTAPQTAPEPVSSIAFCTDAGWVEADITALVADWLGDPQGNQGLMAKFERENREQWVQTQFWGPLCPDDAKRPRIVFECE